MGSQPSSQSAAPRKIAVTSIKIEQDLLDDFKLAAAANRRNVSQELRWLIDQRVAEFRATQAEAA